MSNNHFDEDGLVGIFALFAASRRPASGVVTIEERRDLDLAIVRLHDDLAECQPFAFYSRTMCGRLLLLQRSRAELQYRYESWVQLASRKPAPRVDLSELASELTRDETTGGRWVSMASSRLLRGFTLKGAGGHRCRSTLS